MASSHWDFMVTPTSESTTSTDFSLATTCSDSAAVSQSEIAAAPHITESNLTGSAISSKSESIAVPHITVTTDDIRLTPTAIVRNTAARLKELLEDLPREIYDMIEDLTFKVSLVPMVCELRFPVSRVQHIAHLKLLQLNRATREQNAEAYYGVRTFVSRRNAGCAVRSVSG